MKKHLSIFLAVTMLLSFAFLFSSCGNDEDVYIEHTVTFHANTNFVYDKNGVLLPFSSHVISQENDVFLTYHIGHGNYCSTPTDIPVNVRFAINGLAVRFAGWYKEPCCENAFDFNSEPINTQTHLYAKWIAAEKEG